MNRIKNENGGKMEIIHFNLKCYFIGQATANHN